MKDKQNYSYQRYLTDEEIQRVRKRKGIVEKRMRERGRVERGDKETCKQTERKKMRETGKQKERE